MVEYNFDDHSLILLASITLALVIGSLVTWAQKRRDYSRSSSQADEDFHLGIPQAVGGIPILGHALAYQQDPPSFLKDQQEKVGNVFQINLAGRKMIVIGDDEKARRETEWQPESILSARKAIADIGFEYTLGKRNSSVGPDYHRRILRDVVHKKDRFGDYIHKLFMSLRLSQDKELAVFSSSRDGDKITVPDLFILSRRVVLRTTIDVLLSPKFLHDDNTLLDRIMVFQDHLEDATAKAAVLPKILSLPLHLWPVKRERLNLQKELMKVIDQVWNCDNTTDNTMALGPWLKEFKEMKMSPDEAAEYCIGLLFAAHKNPSIGAAQTLCFLFGPQVNSAIRKTAKAEAVALNNTLISGKTFSANDFLQDFKTLASVVRETMRLVAHSLGALRTAMKPIIIQGTKQSYRLREGDVVAISHILPHLNETAFGKDPQAFDIHRSFESKGTTALTTFSGGMHKCPGEQLALCLMQVLLSLWLSTGVEVENPIPPIDFERATLGQRKTKVRATFSPSTESKSEET